MPNYHIHWKGYPHHRLPRIRVVSPRAPSLASRSPSRQSAGQTFKTPLSSALEEERKKKGFKFRVRHRKEHSWRSSSSVVRAKRRASARARQNIQVFGWDTPEAELASRFTTETAGSASSIRASPGTQPRRVAALQEQSTIAGTNSTAVLSTDGAVGSLLSRTQVPPKDPKAIYSLMQVAELPVYWTTKGKPNRKSTFNPDRLSIHSGTQPLTEYAHTGSIQTVSERATPRNPQAAGGSRAYDPRITPNYRVSKPRVKSSLPPKSRHNTTSRRTLATSGVSPKNKQRKDPSFGDPAFWKAIHGFALQPRTDGSVSPSIRSIVQSVLSDTPSRTACQKGAINRFTKELDLYLQAVKSLPKQTLVASASSSTFSGNTVVELKPYKSEFEKAGLAVTSAEQKSLPKLEPPSLPPTPPKDQKWIRRSSPGPSSMAPGIEKKLGKSPSKGKHPSIASGSTGTDVIGFTPPHEKTYARAAAHRGGSSSDGSVLGWTPPHERAIAQPPQAVAPATKSSPSAPRTSTKKSLPWLRRLEPLEKFPSSTKKYSAPAEEKRPSTPLGGWLESFEIKDVPLPPKFKNRNESNVTPRGGISHRSTEVRFTDQRNDNVRTARSPTKSAQRAEAVTRNDSPNIGTPKIPENSRYAETGTLIDSATSQQKSDINRAPVPSGRNQTFPIKTNRCKGECSHVSEPLIIPPKNPPRQSKVGWRGIGNSTQTDITQPLNEDMVEDELLKKIFFAPVDKKVADRNRTFQIAAGSGRGAGPFQQSPVLRSPNKSVDERKLRTNKCSRESEDFQPEIMENNPVDPPTRRPPSPPVCTQCACCGESKSDPVPEPEPEMEWSEQRPERSHTCSAQSLQCQQCFPTEQSSPATCPIQQSNEVEVFYGTSRRSTRPTIPAEQVIYQDDPATKQTPKPIKIIENSINSFKKEEPVADPMKKLPVVKLKLRSPPAPQPRPIPDEPKPTPRPKPLPKQPVVKNKMPPPVAASETTIDTSPNLSDKKVFRGLHVATAAACDEDIDKWIEEITGCSARKFLSDLSAFDGLGVNTLADVAKRAAKQRRERVRAWEAVRERKRNVDGVDVNCVEWEDVREGLDGKMGSVAPDVKGHVGKGKGREDLVDEMRRMRDERGSEGVKRPRSEDGLEGKECFWGTRGV